MVAAASAALEVRPVEAGDFGTIYPLLCEFRNRKMSRGDWRRMLFDYPWAAERERGYALFAGGAAVGFLGTITARRRLAGREQIVCNPSCWFVREPYRHASMLLLKPVLARRDHTIVNLTPTPRSYEIFVKFGFRELEREQVLLPPLASPLGLRGSFACVESDSPLSESEREIHRQLAGFPGTCELVLRDGARSTYLIASRLRYKRMRFAELHYVGDLSFFWEHRALAHRALFAALGCAALALDGRFAQGRRPPFALRRPARRLYRPLVEQTEPHEVDNLFSELLTLRV
ncbi:MAG: hypothetical protein ACREM2_01650 [Vulcanimicrobiaceae bacterium]